MIYKTKKNATLMDTIMEIYHGISKQKAKQIISHSIFYLDGVLMEKYPKIIVESGKTLEIASEMKESKNKLPTRNNPIAIFYEDIYCIISLKPAGIVSCSDKSGQNDKSFHKLLENYIHIRDGRKSRLWIIHRLDKEVEGFIIFAKNEDFQQLMKDNWQHVDKKYLALCENKPDQDSGIIESWLLEGLHQKVASYSTEIKGSKFARTEFSYLRKEKSYHLLEVKLHSGRKNQIRVHLASINCPIVGDHKYGASASVKRQIRLAAYKLEFKHPVKNEQIRLEYNPISRFFNPSKNEDEKYKII